MLNPYCKHEMKIVNSRPITGPVQNVYVCDWFGCAQWLVEYPVISHQECGSTNVSIASMFGSDQYAMCLCFECGVKLDRLDN